MLLRSELDAPSIEEIQEVLDFLASKLVAAVEKRQGKYALIDHVSLVSRRVLSLGAMIRGAEAGAL